MQNYSKQTCSDSFQIRFGNGKEFQPLDLIGSSALNLLTWKDLLPNAFSDHERIWLLFFFLPVTSVASEKFKIW